VNRIAAMVLAIPCASAAGADEGPIRGGTETFKLNLGTVLNQNSTGLRIEGPQGRGVDFNLEGATGIQRDRWTTLASGTWRFSPNHRVGFQSFSTRAHAGKTLEQDLVIKDQTIPAGTGLETSSKTSFLIANYQYSLMRDDRVELSAMAGVYGARFKYQFDSTNPPRNIDAKTTAPVPMFGLALDTFLTPRWTISAFVEGLKLNIGDVAGSLGYIGVSTDYMLTRHLGLGLGMTSTHMRADVTQPEFSGSFDWRATSYFAYGQVRF
jgi:hypothetical protein